MGFFTKIRALRNKRIVQSKKRIKPISVSKIGKSIQAPGKIALSSSRKLLMHRKRNHEASSYYSKSCTE